MTDIKCPGCHQPYRTVVGGRACTHEANCQVRYSDWAEFVPESVEPEGIYHDDAPTEADAIFEPKKTYPMNDPGANMAAAADMVTVPGASAIGRFVMLVNKADEVRLSLVEAASRRDEARREQAEAQDDLERLQRMLDGMMNEVGKAYNDVASILGAIEKEEF